jgi:type I restriction enzyme, S subunit
MLQSDPSGEDDELQPYLRAINIAKSGVNLSHQFSMWIKPHEREKFRLRPDDVLVSEGGDAGRTAQFTDDGEYYFQNAINRVRPLDRELVDSRFLYYWFTFLKLAGYVELICNIATIAHFTAEKVKASPFALPPLETQRRITAFLDEKTAQIDGLIARKQTLLARLAEKRQAIITQAVTKGLNPAAPLKDSGIDWLGQIPAHWEVKPLKRVIFYQEGPGIMAADFRDEGVPLLRVASVGGRWSTLNGVNFLEPEMVARKWEHFLTREGDLLISASATSGIVSEVGKDTVGCVPYTGIIRLNEIQGESVSAFIRHFVVARPFLAQIDQLKAGSTIQHFGPYHLGLMFLAVPPVDEQVKIAEYLDFVLSQCSHAEHQIGQSLTYLNEYRSALITSAVTGQMKGLS